MIKTLAVLLAGILVVSSALTPLVYQALTWWMGAVPWPFSRVYDRVAMAAALVIVLLLRKQFSLQELKPFYARGTAREKVKLVFWGLVIAFGCGLAAFPFALRSDVLSFSPRPWDSYLPKAAEYLAAALLISVIEESSFRLLLFKKLKERLPIGAAALICSLVYAFVHFIKPDKTYVYVSGSWFSGFEYTWHVLETVFSWQIIAPMLGLLCIGLLLCYVIQRTGSLYLCIGLHAGWVWIEKLAKVSTVVSADALAQGVSRRFFLIGQPVIWCSIGAVFLILLLLVRRSGFACCESNDN